MQNQSSAPPSLHAFLSPLSALLQSPPTRFRRRDLHLLFCCCSRHGFPDGEASGSQRLRLTCFCILNCARVHVYRRLLYVCVCMYLCLYTCVYSFMKVYTHAWICLCMYASIWVCICMHIIVLCPHICAYMSWIYVCTCMHLYVCIPYAYMCFFVHECLHVGFPGGSDGKQSACNVGRPGLDHWVGKIHWRRAWQPTPVFLPGESHGQRSLVGYSPWGRRVWDDWATNTHVCAHAYMTMCMHVYQHMHACLCVCVWKEAVTKLCYWQVLLSMQNLETKTAFVSQAPTADITARAAAGAWRPNTPTPPGWARPTPSWSSWTISRELAERVLACGCAAGLARLPRGCLTPFS